MTLEQESPTIGATGLRTPSLRRRVTITVLILLAAMLLTLALTTDVVLGNRLNAQLRNRLLDRAQVAVALVDQVSPQELVRRLEGDGVSVELRTSDGGFYTAGPLRSASSSTSASPDPAPGPAGPGGKPAPKGPAGEVVADGDLLSVTRELSTGATIRLLADAADVRRTLSQVRLVLLLGAALLLALGAVVLGPVIARALRPLEEITGVARSISNGDRGQRLRPDRPDTELGRTASAFDAMLDSVEGAERHALESEERLRTFLSDASHELRTPLTGIHAAAEHLLRSDPPREERERVLINLIRETRRSSRLVDDLLLVSRIDRGLDLRRSEVDLLDVGQTVIEDRRITWPEASLSISGSAGRVWADRDRVAQVLGNVVDNALRATHGRGTVDLVVASSETEASVEVTDDGPGVPETERDRIFERLVRLDSARSHDQGGAGLGLSIARGIARVHGGDLRCLAPRTGSGARFLFTVPLGR